MLTLDRRDATLVAKKKLAHITFNVIYICEVNRKNGNLVVSQMFEVFIRPFRIFLFVQYVQNNE